MRFHSTPVLLALTVSVLVSACSDPVGDAERASSIDVHDTDELGSILSDGQGNVLYVFEPDDAASVSCTFTCATNWPPLVAVDGATPAAGGGVDESLLGTTSNPSGGDVVTYKGWPLYRYAADKSPGEHRGQDINLNGGLWYVMQPDGNPLIP